MTELIILVVIGTSIWVAFDAPSRGITAWWALACLALWIVAFPWYLVARNRTPVPHAAVPATQGRWEPDPRKPETHERWREGTQWTGAVRKRDL